MSEQGWNCMELGTEIAHDVVCRQLECSEILSGGQAFRLLLGALLAVGSQGRRSILQLREHLVRDADLLLQTTSDGLLSSGRGLHRLGLRVSRRNG